MLNVGKVGRSRHQAIIRSLEQRLTESQISYQTVDINVEYWKRGKTIGEIDLLALHGKYELYFEIKSNHTLKGYSKARKQLRRIKKRYATPGRAQHYFYVSGTKEGGYKIQKVMF